MIALIPGVSRKATDEMASKKLGEVFKVLAKSDETLGFVKMLNFSCLIRSKPKGWVSRAGEIIAATDRNTFYLRAMLIIALNQFRDEVNTTAERQELKKLIAIVRLKRDFKKENPGEKDIRNFLARMETQGLFDDVGQPDTPLANRGVANP